MKNKYTQKKVNEVLIQLVSQKKKKKSSNTIKDAYDPITSRKWSKEMLGLADKTHLPRFGI